MTKKRVLITGGSGFLGWHLSLRLRETHEVWACYLSHPFEMGGITTLRLNITNEEDVMEQIAEVKPDIIIHTAALTDVDRCEEEGDDAYTVNVAGTAHVARASSSVGALLIYISTDLVFGEGKGMFTEEDVPTPLNYYGVTKLEGEKEVATYDSAVTLRVVLMYGADTGIKGSFLRWMKRGLESGEGIRLYTDQFRTPLYTDDAVAAIEAVIRGRARKRLYHIGGPERIDRYGFGRIYAGVFGYDPALITPVTMDEAASRARRPHDCSLSIESARRDLGFNPRPVRQALSNLKESLLPQAPHSPGPPRHP